MFWGTNYQIVNQNAEYKVARDLQLVQIDGVFDKRVYQKFEAESKEKAIEMMMTNTNVGIEAQQIYCWRGDILEALDLNVDCKEQTIKQVVENGDLLGKSEERMNSKMNEQPLQKQMKPLHEIPITEEQKQFCGYCHNESKKVVN